MYASRPEGEDCPPHVRAASALVRVGEHRFLVASDDANILSVVDLATSAIQVTPYLLARASDGRRVFDDQIGNKRLKLDLEAGFAVKLPGEGCQRVYFFGSGSLADVRDHCLVVNVERGEIASTSLALLPMYAVLREQVPALNIEGAWADTKSGHIVWMHRAVSASGAGAENVAFVCAAEGTTEDSLSAMRLARSITIALPQNGRVLLGITDVCPSLDEDDVLYFLAVAEATDNPQDDGEVVETRFGRMQIVRGDAGEIVAFTSIQLFNIVNTDGAREIFKPEGLCSMGEGTFVLTVDRDDPNVPSDWIVGRLVS